VDTSTAVAVDRYIEALFAPADPALDAAVKETSNAGMPQIQVSPTQGKLLYLLARVCRAQRILELGTLGGYSTIWLARALPPDGQVISLESDARHAGIARTNLARADMASRVEIVEGPALETLPQIEARGGALFDMVFIDADKGNYSAYLEWAVRLTRPGGLIVADNVVRGGNVLAPDVRDVSAKAARAFNAALAADPRVEAIVIQQFGVKGHDGFALAVVKDPQ